jgi:hypothetical protein
VDRAHRLASRSSPRPIIALFSYWREKELVLENGARLWEKKRISVSQDFAARTRTARGALFKVMKAKREEGWYAVVRLDRLIVSKRGEQGRKVFYYDHDTRTVVEERGRRPADSEGVVHGSNKVPLSKNQPWRRRSPSPGTNRDVSGALRGLASGYDLRSRREGQGGRGARGEKGGRGGGGGGRGAGSAQRQPSRSSSRHGSQEVLKRFMATATEDGDSTLTPDDAEDAGKEAAGPPQPAVV